MQIQSDHLKLLEIKAIYEERLLDINFDQIEHIPNEMIIQDIKIEENCLCIRHNFFDKYYGAVIKHLLNPNAFQMANMQSNMYAEIILIMNGENDRAWSIKRCLLLQNKLNIIRQLRFNAAICYKNKKSFSYYEFRLRLMNYLITNQQMSKQQLIELYRKENDLMKKILQRFHRNYQCWLYRIKLYQLFHNQFHEQILQLEIKLLHAFIQKNPNDYSAYSRLISIVFKNKVNISAEREWIIQLYNFCVVAYQKQSSYNHITTYLNFLQKVCKS